MNEQGNISFVFVFIILAITIIFMFAFLSPALQDYTLRVYTAAEPTLDDANVTAGLIQDTAMRNQIRDALQNSKDTTSTSIEVLNFFYQYAWLFVIALSAIILLLYSRFLVERQVGGAV